MLRRNLIMAIGSTAISWPWIAIAQKSSDKVWRIAYLYPGSLTLPVDRAIFGIFRAEMATLGYVEGKSLIIDDRSAEGKFERLPSLTNELIALRPDVIVAVTTPAIAAAQRATSTIPIIMAPATDPVAAGFIKSLAHPGGNITGIANMLNDSIGKSVELLHAIQPNAKRIAVLMSTNPAHPRQYELVEIAAKALDLAVVPIMAAMPADLEQAFNKMDQEKCDAIFVLADPTLPKIISLAEKTKIPALYQFANPVDLGGLASYGASTPPLFRKVAVYVDRIFKGAAPADIPVEQPVVFEFVLNLKAAAAIGLSIPDAVVARADRVIE